MIPEIRQNLSTVYPELHDNACVHGRESIPGMDTDTFFFSHSYPESADANFSKYNEAEAEMIVEFFLYLHMNGMSTEKITVLTFYHGQRKFLTKLLRQKRPLFDKKLKVVTADSYQGEENEVVLLSLTRSNVSACFLFHK